MKHFAWVLVAVLCTSVLTFAGEKGKKDDSGKASSMSGMVCYSKCVTTTGKKSSCNKNCTETSGDMVFVSDKGKMMKIDNQDKVSGMSGKKVKVKGSMMGADMMHIDEIAPVTY